MPRRSDSLYLYSKRKRGKTTYQIRDHKGRFSKFDPDKTLRRSKSGYKVAKLPKRIRMPDEIIENYPANERTHIRKTSQTTITGGLKDGLRPQEGKRGMNCTTIINFKIKYYNGSDGKDFWLGHTWNFHKYIPQNEIDSELESVKELIRTKIASGSRDFDAMDTAQCEIYDKKVHYRYYRD